MKKKLIFNNLFASIFITFLVLLILKYTYAATIYYDGDDVGYDNTASGFKDSNNVNVEEVQTAMVELNKKARNCYDVALNVGDYFSLTPDVQTYTFPKSISGYTSDQSLQIGGSNANYGLRLWRVIDIHCDGSFDAVSEYLSYNTVYFRGSTGYKNFVAGLQTIAAQFAKEGYTIDTRMMGYGGQTHSIGDITAFNGSTTNAPSIITSTNPTTGVGMEFDGGVLGDTLYLRDYQLVSNVYGSTGLKAYRASTSTNVSYWLASRYYLYGSATSFRFAGRMVTAAGALSYGDMRYYSGSWADKNIATYYRPIISIRSGVTVASGSGTKNSPYMLSLP